MPIGTKSVYFTVYLLTQIYLTPGKGLQDNSLRMLNDFVKSKNLMLILHTCWSKGKLAQFSNSGNNGNHNSHFFSVHKQFLELPFKTTKLMLIIDLNNCTSAWSTFYQINMTNSFISPIKYFVLTDVILDIIPVLQNFTVYPLSDVIVAEKYASYDYKLHAVYRINAVSELIWETYGYWSPKFGLIEYLKKYPISRRRRNLRQKNLKVTIRISDNDTWNHLEDFRYPSIDSFTKLSFGSNRCLLDYCNVNATYIGTKDFGYTDKTGKFNGLVADLLSGKADISANALLETPERLNAIAYMSLQSPYYIKFILRKPPLSFVKNIFASAFDKTVWLAMVIALVVFAFAAYLTLNIEAKDEQHLLSIRCTEEILLLDLILFSHCLHFVLRNYALFCKYFICWVIKIGGQRKISVTDVILLALEVLSQQGTSNDPKRISGRILEFIFFLSFFFVFVVYSANVIAMLTAQVRLKSSRELLQSKMEIGAEDDDVLHFYLPQDQSDVGKEIYRRIGTKGYYCREVGMEKVRKGSFAYQVLLGEAYDYIIRNFTNTEICSIQEIEGYFEHLRAYHVTQKKSPYKEIFRTAALRVDEHGLRHRNHIRWYVKPQCRTQMVNYASVGLLETQMAFLLILYGTFFALICLVLENAVYYVRKNKKSRISIKLKRKQLFENII